jgi:VanZ family protein
VMCCFLMLRVGVFFNSPTHPPMKAGIEWCAALLWFHVLEYFSTVLPNSYLWSRDWVMCCSLWFTFSPTPTYKAGIKVMCCSLWFHVLEYFSTVHLPTYEAGIKDVLLSLWFHVLEYFSTVPAISTYKAGIEWCAALCD